MRVRLLKPETFKDEHLAETSMAARVLFMGLWTLADREGRLEDRPKWIRAELLPYDPSVDVDALLNELANPKAFILRYEVEGRKFIQLTNFLKHQKPHPREAPSSLPAPRQAKANQGAPKANQGAASRSVSNSDSDSDSVRTDIPPSSSVDSKASRLDDDVESARVELRKALQAFREFVDTGESDQVILELPKFHSTAGGVVRIEACTNAKLMLATAVKVRAAIKPRKTRATKDSSDWVSAEAAERAEVEAWISANWPADANPQTAPVLRALLVSLDHPLYLRQALEAALFERHPAANADFAASVEAMKAQAVAKNPLPKPTQSITVAPGRCPICDGPVTHSTEDGARVIRCLDDQGLRCAWAAIWRECAA